MIVQKNAMRVWKDKRLNLKDLLLRENEITSRFSKKHIESLFDLSYHLKHVDFIFKRVFAISVRRLDGRTILLV